MKENKKEKTFWRIFKYVWPQWPRLIVVVSTAFVVAFLFALSFVTIGPLLKVMMGEEGIHGWIDRKTCDWTYGVDFYVPDLTDFNFDDGDKDIAYYLKVTDIEKDGLAKASGLQIDDQIIGAGSVILQNPNKDKVISAKLLEELATSVSKDSISLQLRRFDPQDGSLEYKEIMLKISLGKRSFIDDLKISCILKTQELISFMPRSEPKENRQRAVIFIILIMAVVTIVRCTATFYQKYMAEKVVQIAIARLREEAFNHVMNMPTGFFSTEGTSDTTSRIIGDTAATGNGVKVLLGKALREPLKALGTLCWAMVISVKLTLIFLCLAPVTVVLLGLLGKKIKKATKKSLMSSALMLGKIQDVMRALRIIKVYNRQEYENRSYGALNSTFLRRVLRVAKVQAATGPIMDVLGMVAGSAALLVGVHWIFSASYNMEPSNFFLLLVLLGTTAESIRKVSDVWPKVNSANAAAERIFAVVDAPPESEVPDAIDLAPLHDCIEFKDIVFKYPGSNEPVLRGINLRVNAGQTIAVVGPNGSGKTTLINLIPRFYDVDSGEIMIDGHDICHATLKSLRGQIGMVTQNVVTFNATISENIGYGKKDATMEEIVSAAKRSFAHEFIELQEDGYDTFIGEHGSGFSGGQLQRIVIARAIVKNPAILIFDEAMSQVDADSEAKIHKALSELMQGRTCFIIAHRFSTVISADSIVVMDEGQIVAQGKHEELVQSCSLYQSLYETQLLLPE
jgi:ABC-type multidrug transport system fused ATPase/permease subunit